MLVTRILKPGDKPTKEMIEEIERADRMPITPDEDCPAYSYEQLTLMCAEAQKRKKEKSSKQ
jgi:hypothetical protein